VCVTDVCVADACVPDVCVTRRVRTRRVVPTARSHATRPNFERLRAYSENTLKTPGGPLKHCREWCACARFQTTLKAL
jgi:hypothetical protein